MVGVMPCDCGNCRPCRVKRRRVWSHRLMLESMCHGDSSFVTLTYRDDALPEGGSLNPDHVQSWLKRLRERVAPRPLRFYLAGEYGPQTWRPHYHVALFGYPPCFNGRTNHVLVKAGKGCCASCSLLAETWGHGGVDCGSLSEASASYIAGYVNKKMTKKDDPRLAGRHPEFTRMSLKPGIGAPALLRIADALASREGEELIRASGDVPSALSHGRRLLPMGRYLRMKWRQLRKGVVVSDEVQRSSPYRRPRDPYKETYGSSEISKQTYASALRELFEETLKESASRSLSLKGVVVKKTKQAALNLETRLKILESIRSL